MMKNTQLSGEVIGITIALVTFTGFTLMITKQATPPIIALLMGLLAGVCVCRFPDAQGTIQWREVISMVVLVAVLLLYGILVYGDAPIR